MALETHWQIMLTQHALSLSLRSTLLSFSSQSAVELCCCCFFFLSLSCTSFSLILIMLSRAFLNRAVKRTHPHCVSWSVNTFLTPSLAKFVAHLILRGYYRLLVNYFWVSCVYYLYITRWSRAEVMRVQPGKWHTSKVRTSPANWEDFQRVQSCDQSCGLLLSAHQLHSIYDVYTMCTTVLPPENTKTTATD